MLQFDTSLNSEPKNYKKNNHGVASVYEKIYMLMKKDFLD